jgi:peptidoglycan/xylan/chitin deacetylase (PgdA/CDA1 family)
MYHRVAEPGLDPWNLCVGPDNFRRQIQRLSQEYDISRLSELRAGDKGAGKAFVTFDDGYVDNLTIAAPVLREFSVPATIFVSTSYIGGEREFWWDALEQLLLLPGALPETLELEFLGTDFRFKFKEHRVYSKSMAREHRDWKVTFDGARPPTERHELFLILWEKLQKSSRFSRRRALEYLFAWAEKPQLVRPDHRPMRADELRQINSHGHIEIGSHCVTHTPLPDLDLAAKKSELEASKAILEDILHYPVTSLAYPHGEYDEATIELAEQAGYCRAFGTNSPRFSNQKSIYQLPRTMVLDSSF